MSRIAMVISDVDGTLLTKDKQLTDAARAAVARLGEAGIKFTITSSRPPIGMRMLVEPLALALPMGPFNGSSVVTPDFKVVTQHLIPEAAVRRALDLLAQYGVDAWLFTNEQWMILRDDGKYVPHERKTIAADPVVVADFTPFVASACKIVGASPDADLLARCETAMQAALGADALAVRSQAYYLDITPPGQDKGTFVTEMSRQLNIPTGQIAVIGDMRNDLAMFAVAGLAIAMGNATDDVKQRAAHVTASNAEDGFAKAMDYILKRNADA